jgi:hypothetical protein
MPEAIIKKIIKDNTFLKNLKEKIFEDFYSTESK